MIYLVFCVVLCVSRTGGFSVDNVKARTRCSHLRDHGMLAADCYGLDLTAVPQNLRTDIEVLQLTRNRIRDLYKDSFKNYAYLKVLYLDDNMISYIENGTFVPLQNLEAIRLSSNALDRIPADVLRLPNLRKIFMDNNRLRGNGGFTDAPTSETLESLTLSHCHLEEFPPLDIYPHLLELNISKNALKRISPQQLAPMCQLHWLDLSGNPKLSEESSGDGCDCHLLASWIANKNIILQGGYKLNCTSNGQDFTHCGNMTEAAEMFDSCMHAVITKAEVVQNRKTWLLVVVIVAATLGTVMLALFCLHRRNKRKNKTKNIINNNNGKSLPAEEGQELGTDELLQEIKS